MNKQKLIREVLSWFGTLITSLVLVSVVYLLIIRPVQVDGDSMNPTLSDDEFVLIVPNVTTVKYGDIVVLQSGNKREELYVKRVIATAGQTVEIDSETGNVIVDGNVLAESYILEDNYTLGDAVYPQVVEKDHVFVLGDNRNHSTDSRFSSLGQVSLEDIEGKVVFRVTPINKLGKVL